jgi:enoyl-CoA hydratase
VLKIERDGPIAIWTIARAETKNALSFAVMQAIDDAIVKAQHDPTLRAIVLTGEGKVFVSGGDLRELRAATTAADAERLSDWGRRICDGIAQLEVPVIAAVNGPAIGGGAELAVACDLRIADERAKICFKHARMGLVTSWGTLPRLLSLVGPGTAARLLYTSHEVRAMEARAMGLVDWVADEGACVATALAWALDVVQGSPTAIREMKGLLRHAATSGEFVRARERERFVATWTSADHQEAVEAFFESRAAVWGKKSEK